MEKKSILWLGLSMLIMVFVMGPAARATFVDDFTSDTLDPAWVASTVLDTSDAVQSGVWDTTTHDNQLTGQVSNGGSGATQVVLLRNDVGLPLVDGEEVSVDFELLNSNGLSTSGGLVIGTATGVTERKNMLMVYASNSGEVKAVYFDNNGSPTKNSTTYTVGPINLMIRYRDYGGGDLRYKILYETATDGVNTVGFYYVNSMNSPLPGDSVGLYMGNGDNTGDHVFDNFVVTPEPATFGLMALGCLSLLKRKRV